MMQQWQTMKTLYEQNPVSIPEMFLTAAKAETLEFFVEQWAGAAAACQTQNEQHADPSISQWPLLALAWTDKIRERQ